MPIPITSPWWPLAVAQSLAPSGPQRVVNLAFEVWIAWRAALHVPEQSQENMLAHVQAAIAALPQ